MALKKGLWSISLVMSSIGYGIYVWEQFYLDPDLED